MHIRLSFKPSLSPVCVRVPLVATWCYLSVFFHSFPVLSLLLTGVEKVLSRCMSLHGQKPMLDLKKKGGGAVIRRFLPSVYVLYDLLHWIHRGSINSALKYMLQVTLSPHMPSRVYRTPALEKPSIVLYDLYIRAISYCRSLFFFVLGALARSLAYIISSSVSCLLI